MVVAAGIVQEQGPYTSGLCGGPLACCDACSEELCVVFSSLAGDAFFGMACVLWQDGAVVCMHDGIQNMGFRGMLHCAPDGLLT